MKKIIILVAILIIAGCDNNKVTNEYKIYEKYIDELENTTNFIEQNNYDLEIEIEQINEKESMYVLTLDNVKTDMYEIEVIVIHNKKTEDIYPSSGIFEDKIDISKNDRKVKGIQLIGFIEDEENIEFKALIKYNDFNGEPKKDYYIKQF